MGTLWLLLLAKVFHRASQIGLAPPWCLQFAFPFKAGFGSSVSLSSYCLLLFFTSGGCLLFAHQEALVVVVFRFLLGGWVMLVQLLRLLLVAIVVVLLVGVVNRLILVVIATVRVCWRRLWSVHCISFIFIIIVVIWRFLLAQAWCFGETFLGLLWDSVSVSIVGTTRSMVA